MWSNLAFNHNGQGYTREGLKIIAFTSFVPLDLETDSQYLGSSTADL